MPRRVEAPSMGYNTRKACVKIRRKPQFRILLLIQKLSYYTLYFSLWSNEKLNYMFAIIVFVKIKIIFFFNWWILFSLYYGFLFKLSSVIVPTLRKFIKMDRGTLFKFLISSVNKIFFFHKLESKEIICRLFFSYISRVRRCSR